jgi:hypothetical protein
MDNKTDKKTEEKTREYEVSGNQILTLPLLPLHSLEIASSPEAAAFVVETLHDPINLGFPLVHMYRESGMILHPISKTTAHVLVVVDDGPALNTLAIYHHIYSKLGYTLIFDETTCLVDLPPESKSGDSNESTSPTDNESKPMEASVVTLSGKQTKLDVVGMEVA